MMYVIHLYLIVRNTNAILLLSLIFFSQIGYQAINIVQHLIIRKEQRSLALRSLPESMLETFNDDDRIDWVENDREFYLNGKMYDVVKIRIIHGERVIFAINDDKEAEVLQKIEKGIQAQQENGPHKKGGVAGIKFHKLVFALDASSAPLMILSSACTFRIFNARAAEYFIADIIVPPPQC